MTLTEFLLARITEDKAVAHAKPPMTLARHDAEFHHAEFDGFSAVWTSADRLLAECEAKRQIVEEFRDCLDAGGTEGDIVRFILPRMALPYANHPDYRQEWRP